VAAGGASLAEDVGGVVDAAEPGASASVGVTVSPGCEAPAGVGSAADAAGSVQDPAWQVLADAVDGYAIFEVDRAGLIRSWNRGAEHLFGFTAREVLERPLALLRPPAEAQRSDEASVFVRRDGSQFRALATLRPLGSHAAQHDSTLYIVRELEPAAEDLRRSEERFRLLVEGVSDYAVYMLDPSGRVTTWNSGAERIKGYSASEIIGQSFQLFFTPEDAAAGRPAQELSIAAESGRFEEEAYRVRKDGTRFWANVVVRPLRDSAGRLAGFAKVTRDLTARRAAEETERQLLREQAARVAAEEAEALLKEERERYRDLNQRLQAILEGIADGITVRDARGRIQFANTAAARQCGFVSVEELLQARPEDIRARFEMLDSDGRPLKAEQLPGYKVERGAESATIKMRVRSRATGAEWWSLLRAYGVPGPHGTPELVINVWHDVTREQRREEAEKYLAQATAVLYSSLDPSTTLGTTASLLVPGLADWCAISLCEGDELKNVAVAHVDSEKVGLARDYQERYPTPRHAPSGSWRVIDTGESELHSEIADELLVRGAQDEQHLIFLRSLGMKSAMIVPIRVRERVFGTMSLISAESGRRYDERDLAVAEELGRRVGVALENADLYAAEKKTREQLELIARAGEFFAEATAYDQVLESVVQVVLPSLADFAFFDVVEGDSVRRIAAAYADAEIDTMLKGTRWARSERTDKNLCALSSGEAGFHPTIDRAFREDIALGPEHLEVLEKLGLCSMITVPVRAHGELVGALTICYGRSGRHYSQADLRLVEELARRAGIAIAQARLYETAQANAKAAALAAERAETAGRIKDEFLATVSHELRTPLNAIFGWASLLRTRATDAQVKNAVEVIYRNARAQAKIIDDILDMSRIITGKLRLELRSTDLELVAGEALEVVRPSAQAKGITLELSSDCKSCQLVADPDRLQQVVWNLLSNAVKFTEAGGSVKLRLARDESGLILSVSDTGAGIDPEFLPYVFDRFKQADSSTTRRVGGLGLGLAIVRHIVELHGGRVQAESAGVGQGATFSIHLPASATQPVLESPTSSLQSPREPEEGGRRVMLHGLRILVIDDDPDARELIATLLGSSGAEVLVAASSHRALETLEVVPVDLMISDLGMPDVDGFELMRRARALGHDVPAIALSAYTRREDKEKALGAGFNDHLNKPVNPLDLVDAVARLSRARSAD
jgi:hypothetical protein